MVITLPLLLSPGDYVLEVGMYRWPALERLRVTAANSNDISDNAILPVMLHVANGR